VLKTITDAANRTTTYTYSTGLNSDRLWRIIYPDGKSTEFTYSFTGRLTQIRSHDKFLLTINYSGSRVSSLSRYEKNASILSDPFETLEFDYGNGVTRVTDNHGRYNEYLFDRFGQVLNASDQDGNLTFSLYEGGAASSPSFTSTTQTIARNLLKNSGFEENSDWTQYYAGGTAGTIDYTTEEKKNGNRSMMLKNESATNGAYNAVGQSVGGTRGKTYTLTADMLLPWDLIEGSAWLGIRYQNASGNWEVCKGDLITSTNGWRRYSVAFILPQNSASTTFIPLLSLEAPDAVFLRGLWL